MTGFSNEWPELSMPELEANYLRNAYREATVILEYGSGGSTVFAAQQPGKLVIAVESDRDWALRLQEQFDDADLPSPAILHHSDMGVTGRWGRPKDESAWRHFHRYPTTVWSEPFFRAPDLVLIDGRLRPACFVNACIRSTKPMTVLFDDYANRPMYHCVEVLVKPVELVGRMAVFHVTPREWPEWTDDLLAELSTLVSLEADTVDYGELPDIPLLKALGGAEGAKPN